MNRKNPLTRLFALVMAAVLAVGLVPSSAWASKLDYKTVTLQIAYDIDGDGADDLAVNRTYRFAGDAVVNDLFLAAKANGDIQNYTTSDYGFVDGLSFQGDINIDGTYDAETGVSTYWASYKDGVYDDGTNCHMQSKLQDGAKYQFEVEGYKYGATDPVGPTHYDWTKAEEPTVAEQIVGKLTTGVTLQIAYDASSSTTKNSQLAVNVTYGFEDGATLEDLFTAAQNDGYINGFEFANPYGYGYYLASVTLKDGTKIDTNPDAYWASFKNGAYATGTECTQTDALVDGATFQFDYVGMAEGSKSYDWSSTTVSPAISNTVVTKGMTPVEPEPDPDIPTVNKYDADKAELLIVNLSGRFRKGGANDAISNSTFEAAVALNQQGLGSSLNAEKILANLEKALSDTKSPMSAGRYAKYILALTSAGVDCTNLTFSDGSVHNAIDEMNKLYDEGTTDVYGAVCILPVYQNYADNGGREAKLIDTIVAAQNEDGLFGATFGDYEYYDSQTTAQAVLALLPYRNSRQDVKTAIDEAVHCLAFDMQNEDGGFKLMKSDTQSNVDATAEIVTALSAFGYDCATGESLTTENGSTPLGWLINQADETLDAYDGAVKHNESMTAATALRGFVTARLAAASSNGEVEPYKLNKVESGSEQKTDGDAQKDNTQKAGDSTKKSSTTKGNVPSTGDETVAAGVVAVLGAAGAFVVFESRRRNAA